MYLCSSECLSSSEFLPIADKPSGRRLSSCILMIIYLHVMVTLRDTLINMRRRLDPFFDRREREAVILLIFSYLKQWSRVDLIINEDKEISDYSQQQISSIVDRLVLGEPIQYITGEARFHGLDFHVEPGVLIPRPETEELVDWILEDYDSPDLRILDVGTGSGCIAIALARALPFPQISALDISQQAISVARRNAEALGVKVSFIGSNMYSWKAARASLDIVVSNPPYIAPDEIPEMEVRVKEYEPGVALFVGQDDPVKPYRRLEDIAGEALVTGGRLYMELNPRFAAEVAALFTPGRWSDVEIRRDSYGKERMLRVTRL